jgi:hypothetical protein
VIFGQKMAKKKADSLRGWQKERQEQRRGVGWAEVEVEKRISPLRGSQMSEPLRSKTAATTEGFARSKNFAARKDITHNAQPNEGKQC